MNGPDHDEAELNSAILLYQQQRFAEARAALQRLLARTPDKVTAWNVLGYLDGDLGDAASAANAFERALALDPRDPIALNGRARVALERAEANVVDRYEAARSASPSDPKLALELTEARLSLGDHGAIDEFMQLIESLPQWTEGQIAGARMRWETLRDNQFDEHVRRLLAAQPRRLDLWHAYIELLANSDRHEDAANAARTARTVIGSSPELALIEASHAGWAGDIDRAEALFATVPAGLPGRAIQEAVHLVRRGALDRARAAIDRAIAEDPSDVGTWAIAELIWRALDDPRSAWLSAQPGFGRTLDLELGPDRLEAISALLNALHETGVQMIGQSVREGTQTRWRLFDRLEPELAELKASLEQAIADYVAGLPPVDQGHPLLRHRNQALVITGSWSVRLTGAGRHVSHIHPRGLISSASYFAVPEPGPDDQGALELGRAPGNLLPDLPPLHVVRPQPGQLTLFPSYLHHGTRPFAVGERLSVAFDVNPRPGS